MMLLHWSQVDFAYGTKSLYSKRNKVEASRHGRESLKTKEINDGVSTVYCTYRYYGK